MGLIRAALGSVGGVLADQWKEYFYCEAIPNTVLMVKGHKRSGGRGSNTKGSDNIITTGSVVVVADGQCMLIVEQGKVVEVCAEPGEYTYDAATEPTIFSGPLSLDSLKLVFQEIGKRFAFGGEAPMDQRIYYINIKELVGNKYGTPNPVPFKVVDADIGFATNIGIRCFGEYSYKITNPLLFYKNVCGNVSEGYTREALDSQLKTELLTALQPAFGKLSRVDYTALPAHTAELADALNEVLSAKWRDLRGIEIVSFGISSVTAGEEDEARLKRMQEAAFVGGGNAMAGTAVSAAADAMREAAKNPAGSMGGFVGMGMAQNMGAGLLGSMGQVQQPAVQRPAAGWTCASCGAVNQGKFCSECGAKKPAGALQYKCDKCGWTPADPTHPPKFCPECGDPFDDADKG